MRKFLFVLASTGALNELAQFPPIGYHASWIPTSLDTTALDTGGISGYYAPIGLRTTKNKEHRITRQRTDWPRRYKCVGGECAKGFSEETCRRRGQTYIPPRQN